VSISTHIIQGKYKQGKYKQGKYKQGKYKRRNNVTALLILEDKML